MGTSSWGATLEDSLKNVLAFGSTLKSVTFSRGLNRPAEVEASLDIEGADTETLFTEYASKAVYLRLAENGTTRFFGVLTDLQMQLDDQSSVSVRFADLSIQYATTYPLALLSGTLYGQAAYSASHNSIVDTILDTTDVVLKLTRSGSVTSTRTMDAQGMSRLDVLTGLAELQNGIDWYVEPDQTFKIAANNAIGTDKSATVRFQYGPSTRSNVQSATVQYQPPRNRIWTSKDNGTVKLTTSGDATSRSNYGVQSVVLAQMEKGTSTESDAADQQVRDFPRRVAEFVLEPAFSPRPWTDFNLGDTIGFDLTTPAVSITGSQVVSDITISLDDQLVESDITVSAEVK